MNFSETLLRWYRAHQRDLPWRSDKDPYRVWLSEIILQQTRIDQGLPYFERFLAKYPTVHVLAGASEDDILKSWQGLGYYSRARNLHRTAKIVSEKYNGMFPDSAKELQQLPGIGPYTAAAIASICYGEHVPAIDGNAQRVLARVYGIDTPVNTPAGRNVISSLASELSDNTNPGDFNQALMDFGSMVCTKYKPACRECPFNENCTALRTRMVDQLPAKIPKNPLKNRHFHYHVIFKGPALFMEKRTGNDIWKGLYQLPLTETESEGFDQDLQVVKKYTRTLSHQKLHITIYLSSAKHLKNSSAFACRISEIGNLPVPKVMELFFNSKEFSTLLEKRNVYL